MRVGLPELVADLHAHSHLDPFETAQEHSAQSVVEVVQSDGLVQRRALDELVRRSESLGRRSGRGGSTQHVRVGGEAVVADAPEGTDSRALITDAQTSLAEQVELRVVVQVGLRVLHGRSIKKKTDPSVPVT